MKSGELLEGAGCIDSNYTLSCHHVPTFLFKSKGDRSTNSELFWQVVLKSQKSQTSWGQVCRKASICVEIWNAILFPLGKVNAFNALVKCQCFIFLEAETKVMALLRGTLYMITLKLCGWLLLILWHVATLLFEKMSFQSKVDCSYLVLNVQVNAHWHTPGSSKIPRGKSKSFLQQVKFTETSNVRERNPKTKTSISCQAYFLNSRSMTYRTEWDVHWWQKGRKGHEGWGFVGIWVPSAEVSVKVKHPCVCCSVGSNSPQKTCIFWTRKVMLVQEQHHVHLEQELTGSLSQFDSKSFTQVHIQTLKCCTCFQLEKRCVIRCSRAFNVIQVTLCDCWHTQWSDKYVMSYSYLSPITHQASRHVLCIKRKTNTGSETNFLLVMTKLIQALPGMYGAAVFHGTQGDDNGGKPLCGVLCIVGVIRQNPSRWVRLELGVLDRKVVEDYGKQPLSGQDRTAQYTRSGYL